MKVKKQLGTSFIVRQPVQNSDRLTQVYKRMTKFVRGMPHFALEVEHLDEGPHPSLHIWRAYDSAGAEKYRIVATFQDSRTGARYLKSVTTHHLSTAPAQVRMVDWVV